MGDAGSLLLPDPWFARRRPIVLLREGAAEQMRPQRPTRTPASWRSFGGDRGRPPPRLGREDALAQARVLSALLHSAAAGADARVGG